MRFDVPEVIEAKMKIPQRMMLEDVGLLYLGLIVYSCWNFNQGPMRTMAVGDMYGHSMYSNPQKER